MQENRSFDHYFGSLRGVRGFGDPRAVTLPSGNPVWQQPGSNGDILPFHPPAAQLGLHFLQDLAHDWNSTHEAWNNGNYDGWVQSKGPLTMAHYTRADIPFHYALADAFTICDSYHCSVMGATYPNRHHMWTGWSGNDGQGNGPALDNSTPGFSWPTYPEVLQKAGVTWKIYQDLGDGLDEGSSWGNSSNHPYAGNYGCNTLLCFDAYRNAAPGTPLFERARTGTNVASGEELLSDFRQDAINGTLPQVSWLTSPEAYTEHPNWPANYGAWYISQVLDALTANPETWSKTAFFLLYDENDGFFDHVVPPTPPTSIADGASTVDTSNEMFAGDGQFSAGPFGLGPRVPMLVISPWSRGGFVNSEVFDHTSLIRFIQKRFRNHFHGLDETNITPWRSAVAGDLTSAFDFAVRKEAWEGNGITSLPSTVAYMPPDELRHPDYSPQPPAVQVMPVQEPGFRAARPLPYAITVSCEMNAAGDALTLQFSNNANGTAALQMRSGPLAPDPSAGPWSFTVEGGKSLSYVLPLSTGSPGSYDVAVHGPNGFFRAFRNGGPNSTQNALEARLVYEPRLNGVTFFAANNNTEWCTLLIKDGYSGETLRVPIAPAKVFQQFFPLRKTGGWYDLLLQIESDDNFQQHFAGHLENGAQSFSDPAFGPAQA